MDERFRVYVEQLHDGKVTTIDEVIEPTFLLAKKDSDLAFTKDVNVKGQAYLACSDFILNLSVTAQALIPCSICNEQVPIDIKIKDFYYSQPLDEIKSGIFSFEDLLREIILIEVPLFAECNEGHCPQRKEVAKYMKEPNGKGDRSIETYQPFSDLEL